MESVWTNTTTLSQFEPLEGDAQTDVLIIGGGMAGLLCARHLQDAGIRYILVEANTIGSGITKNTTAKITSQHGLCYKKLASRFGPGIAADVLHKAGIYAKTDLRNEKITYKIREHSVAKIPVIAVVGAKEKENKTVTIRRIGSDKQEVIQLDEFIKAMVEEAKMPSQDR